MLSQTKELPTTNHPSYRMHKMPKQDAKMPIESAFYHNKKQLQQTR